MKHIQRLLLLTVLIAAFVLSCSKSADVTGSIAGKWNLLTDSTFSQIGVSTGKYKIYIGQPGDYWDFRSNSLVYIKEGAVLDTLTYSISSPNTIIINSFGPTFNGVSLASNIVALSRFSATIQSANLVIPGGNYNRTIHLSR